MRLISGVWYCSVNLLSLSFTSDADARHLRQWRYQCAPTKWINWSSVNVNKRSVSTDAGAFAPNYLLGVYLFNSKRTSKVKSQRDSIDNLLFKSLKVWQVIKQIKMLHRVDLQNNIAQSNTIRNFRHVIAYYYLPLLYLSHKRRIWTSRCRHCRRCRATVSGLCRRPWYRIYHVWGKIDYVLL